MRKLFSFIGLSAILLFTSCDKDFDVFIPDDPIEEPSIPLTGQISNFFEAAQGSPFAYQIDISQTTEIHTPNNNYIIIPANSLVDANQQVVEGVVQVELTEVFSKGETIIHHITTESDSKLVESEGAFNLKISQQDEELFLAPDQAITIQIPLQSEYHDGMELFYGERMPDGYFNWQEADENPNGQSSVWLTEIHDSTGQIGDVAYEFQSKQLNWISCNAFVEQSELTTLSLELPEDYTGTNSIAYLVFEEQNSTLSIPWNTEKNQFYSNYIPLNASVHLVVISAKAEDHFHFAQLNTTTTTNETIEINPTEKPLGDILEFLSAL